MKNTFRALWNFLAEWGDYRYKLAKQRGYNYYY
jgi:hypothetical protein